MQDTISTHLVLDLLNMRIKNFKEIEKMTADKKEYIVAQDARSKRMELTHILESVLAFLDNQPIVKCYSCGKPATKPSKYWRNASVCDECDDAKAAEEYAWHCSTGE